MPNGASWIEWDGRRLRWRSDASTPHDLRIDGIVFERIAATADIVSREFEFSPSGADQLTFSLTCDQGALVAAPWRVMLGQEAEPGVDAWSGALPRMQPLAQIVSGAADRKPVAIVVPIFNAPELTERCIDAVIRWTTAPARLILIDDASPDAAIAPLLDRYRHHANISVMRNPTNLGYTRSTNLGMQAAGGADVVLLNSDTQVGPRWLDRLRQVAYSDASVGTVTAVSDNAGAFTVPELERFCPIPERWSLTQTQRALLQNVSDALPELPTGNGFCMYVKRAMLDAVGLLDAAAFPAGYGEENDLCQRAERVGFRHVIAGDVFVAHARSASFGHERRAALGERGMAILRQRYPDYENKVGATLFGFTRRVLDYRVRRIYADTDRLYENVPPRARVLIAGDSSVSLYATLQRYATIDAEFRIRECDDDQPSAVLSDATAVRDWLSTHAIEWIVAQTEQAARLESVARDAGIPLLTVAPLRQPTAPEWSAAWNSVAAFRSES